MNSSHITIAFNDECRYCCNIGPFWSILRSTLDEDKDTPGLIVYHQGVCAGCVLKWTEQHKEVRLLRKMIEDYEERIRELEEKETQNTNKRTRPDDNDDIENESDDNSGDDNDIGEIPIDHGTYKKCPSCHTIKETSKFQSMSRTNNARLDGVHISTRTECGACRSRKSREKKKARTQS